MDKKIFINAKEVSSLMEVSMGHAYKLIRQLNDELKKPGYLVVAGKVPVVYFKKRFYGEEI